MDWINKELREDETVIYRTRSHRYLFISPVAIMLCGLFMRWLFFIGLIYFIYVTIQYFYLEYVITPERVIIKKGLFYIRTVDIPIYLIEDVLIRQSLYDIMIRGGVIYIFGSSIDTRKLSGMGDPLTFRDALFSQLPATSIGFYEEM